MLEKIGGCARIRTLDPLIKSQLLYQLSYTPDHVAANAGRVGRGAVRLAKDPGRVHRAGPERGR